MPSAHGVFSIVIIGVLFSQSQIVQSVPFRSTNCTEFKKLAGGNKAADNYTVRHRDTPDFWCIYC